MNKQLIAIVAAAVVLFTGALVGALALTGNDSSAGNVHTMPNDQMMSGATHGTNGMGSMMGAHTMPGGGMMTEPMHEMDDGQMMPGMDHSP
jgi:hypothetical protein